MRTAVKDTSVEAFYRMLNTGIKTQADRIFDIVNAYCLTTGKDMSLNEIKKVYQGIHSDIELSAVSARVNALVTSNRLQRNEKARSCSVTQRAVYPVRLPSKQFSLL